MHDQHLEILKKWMTAAELDLLRKDMGSADDIIDMNSKVRRIIEKDEHREAIWLFLRRTAQAFIVIVGVLATLKALIPMEWWP